MTENIAVSPKAVVVEIIAPVRMSRRTIVCDCCRRQKGCHEFDEDAYGICCDCLSADVVALPQDKLSKFT